MLATVFLARLSGLAPDAELSPDTRMSCKLSSDGGGSAVLRLEYDTSAAVVSSATTNAAGTHILITFSESLKATAVPLAGAFVITGDDATVASMSITGAVLDLTLTGAIENGDTITIAYTAPTNNGLQDLQGNTVASFTGQAVTNAVP